MSIRKTRAVRSSEFSSLSKSSRDTSIQNSDATRWVNPTYVRNPLWPTVTVAPGDNRCVGLYAVFPWDGSTTDGNFFAILCAGAYTVDYGDGSAPVNVASNTQVNYQYDYNNPALAGTDAPVTITAAGSLISRTAHGLQNGTRIIFYNLSGASGLSATQQYYIVNRTANDFQVSLTKNGSPVTITTDGTATLLPYKIAVVTVTPQAGQNITTFNIQRKHTRTGLTNGFTTGWLSLNIAFPSMTTFAASTNNPTNSVRHLYLEEINIYETGNFTSYLSLFQNTMVNLKRVYFEPTVPAGAVTNTSAMFAECRSLIDMTLPPTLTNFQNTSSMFLNCRAMLAAPALNTSAVTNAASMFSGCTSLLYIPSYNLPVCTTLASFATLCPNLEYCSDLKTSNLLTTVTSMFTTSNSLKRAPVMDTSGVTDFSLMFSGCFLLEEIPFYNTAAGTNFTSMFTNCVSLRKIPPINTSNGTVFTSMFNGCTALREIPTSIRTNLSTNCVNMFTGCRLIEKIHPLVLTSATTLASMFTNCSSLVTVEGITTSTSLTSTATMFSGCSSLKNVPLFETSNVTAMNGMFDACSSIENIPLYNTAACLNFSATFRSCTLLREVPFFNTAAATNMASMFENCTALERIPQFNTASVTNMSTMLGACVTLQEVPLLNTSNVTNVTSLFSGCVILREVPALNFAGVSSAANAANVFLSCFSLQRVRITGMRFSFTVLGSLSAAALNEIYTNLPTVTGQTITVTGNYGIDGDNPAIATAKGWTVTGS